MTPIICAKPSLPKARSPSSPTTRHGRSNIRSTSTSMPSVISWSAASPSSSNFAASQPASKRPPEITLPSSLLQPSSCGCDKCPHYLERDDFSSNRHPVPSFCLSMIPRVEPEGMLFEKPVPTFPDHALAVAFPKGGLACFRHRHPFPLGRGT